VDDDALAIAFARIALEAGAAILQVCETAFAAINKTDGTPVTAADLVAEEIISARLTALLPDVPIVSEEAKQQPELANPDVEFLLVDPLDGTREFVAGRPDYTVNIALIRQRVPIVGVIYAPALLDLYLGGAHAFHAQLTAKGDLTTADLQPIKARRSPNPPVLALSRSHLDLETKGFVDRQGQCPRIDIGSSLKFGLIARGEADLYPRFSDTMEWDTAAGHAVLAAAGGSVRTPAGTPFLYGKADRGYRNGHFIARGAE
jgi:3'(2'), 5'-bisphosphate nucleotidase